MKEMSAMGERVWGYTVKGFEMTSLSSKLTSIFVKLTSVYGIMTSVLMLSPAGNVSFHLQATFLSSGADLSFTQRRHGLHYWRNRIGAKQGQSAAQGLRALQLELGRVGLFQALELYWARCA